MTTFWVPVGMRFGQLTVLGIGEVTTRMRKLRGGLHPIHDAKWRVRCDCGTVKEVWPSNVRAGRTISCGHAQGKARKYDPVCSLEGCDRPHYSRGLCVAHHGRWSWRTKTGNTTPLDQANPRSKYSASAVESVAHIEATEAAARALGVPKSTFRAWRIKYQKEQGS